ncbi:hypothetical protein D3C79_855730 [compost metagenome]
MYLASSDFHSGYGRLTGFFFLYFQGVESLGKLLAHQASEVACIGNGDFRIDAEPCITALAGCGADIAQYPFSTSFCGGGMQGQAGNAAVR